VLAHRQRFSETVGVVEDAQAAREALGVALEGGEEARPRPVVVGEDDERVGEGLAKARVLHEALALALVDLDVVGIGDRALEGVEHPRDLRPVGLQEPGALDHTAGRGGLEQCFGHLETPAGRSAHHVVDGGGIEADLAPMGVAHAAQEAVRALGQTARERANAEGRIGAVRLWVRSGWSRRRSRFPRVRLA
jgi:hypothetical protein